MVPLTACGVSGDPLVRNGDGAHGLTIPPAHRCEATRSASGVELGLDGAVDVAVDVVGADQVDDSVGVKHRQDVGLDAGEAEADVVHLEELVDLRQLRHALGVDEVDALEVEHERPHAFVDEVADPVLERFRRGEEQAAVEPQHDDALERLVVRVLADVAKHLGVGLTAQERHRGLRGDVDEPAEREHDADHDAGEDAGREHADDRSDGDPEIEPGHPVEAAELGDVDHPEHDRVDDDRREHCLRQIGEQRRQHDQRRDHEAARDERSHGRSRPRPTRSASSPRGWSRPAFPGTPRLPRSPSPAPPTPGSTSIR